MNCNEATRLLSEQQDRGLDLSEKTALHFHTLICSGCREFGRQMTTIRHLIQQKNKDIKE